MAETAKDNARLASRLASIAAALAQPNGHGGAPAGLTDEVLAALAKAIVPFVHGLITDAVKPLEARNAVCEQRIVELEAELAKCLKDGGTWKAEKFFHRGEVATHRGVPWICNNSNKAVVPGTSDDWRLMMKSRGHRYG
jgi:hypothetical protein